MRTPNDDTQALYDDQIAGRWLNTITKPNTKRTYVMGLKYYLQFTGKTPEQLVDEAIEDMKRGPKEFQDVVVRRLIGFYSWLKNDITSPKGKKGLSDKAATTHIIAIRSFYAAFNVNVRLRGRSKLPKPKVANRRMIVNAEQVKTLVNFAPNLRDRAVILALFQSGIDISTLCSLKYGDIARGLLANEEPLMLELQRGKTGVEFQTFLGKSAIEAIRVYIKDKESRGAIFEKDTPLFMKETQTYDEEGRSKPAEMDPELIQIMMKAIANKAGFIDSKGYNILGPHALRESFGSIMINSGIPDSVVDFWLGHEIGDMAKAYKQTQAKDLRKMYAEREKLLDPFATVGESETLAQVEALQKTIATMQGRLEEQERRSAEQKKDIEQILNKLKDLVK